MNGSFLTTVIALAFAISGCHHQSDTGIATSTIVLPQVVITAKRLTPDQKAKMQMDLANEQLAENVTAASPQAR